MEQVWDSLLPFENLQTALYNLIFLYCLGYTQECSQETTKPPLYTNWVYSPACNTTTDHCQMKGLNHTKFYNISCYSYKLIDKTIMKSCFDTCRSNRTEDQIECRQSCTGNYLQHTTVSYLLLCLVILQYFMSWTDIILLQFYTREWSLLHCMLCLFVVNR